MPAYISLNKQIQCESICQIIERLVHEHNHTTNNTNNSIIVIDIKESVDAENPESIPKISHK